MLRLFHPQSVQFRITLVIAASFVCAMALYAFVVLRDQQEIYRKNLLFNSQSVGQTIVQSLEDHMMNNDTTGISRTLESIGRQEIIKNLRIYNAVGEVRASMDRAELGTRVEAPETSDQCAVCHQAGKPITIPKGLISYDVDSKEKCMLGVVIPVMNQERCANASCHAHDPDTRYLGFLNMEICRKQMEEAVEASQHQILIISFVIVILAPLLIVLILRSSVTRPLLALVEGTRKVARGEYDVDLTPHRPDEIGELASAFNVMVQRVCEAKEELQSWNRTLESRVEAKAGKLKVAQRQIIQAEKMSSLGRLAAVIAHEINNPISGLVVFIRLLKKQMAKEHLSPEERDRIAKNMELMESEALRCGNIVSELLAFSREDNKLTAVSIPALIERTVSILALQARERGVGLSLEVGEGIPSIEGDAGKLQQVLMNLVQNAVEAMPAGGECTISASVDAEAGEIHLSVRDTGVGIPAGDLPRIFEPFYSSKNQGNSVGVGLFVVYGVVEQHRGTIRVESETNKGTVFKMVLPIH